MVATRMSLSIPPSVLALFTSIFVCLSGCQVEQTTKKPTTDRSAQRELPSLERQFACLPAESAIIAAHRGNSRNMGLAENVMPSLKALYEGGILMAEIDVAGLKDGTHILFHDGVWEEDTTGRGVVAATTWAQASSYLLRDDQGKLTSSVPARLDEALAFAKGKMYLEIDFKSSAKYDHVISQIKNAGLENHVILIAYNDKQVRALRELAPDMMISASVRSLSDIEKYNKMGLTTKRLNAWMGTLTDDLPLAQALSDKGITVLAMGQRQLNELAGPAHVLVSDYALSDKSAGPYPGIIGLNKDNLSDYEACLSET